LLIGLTVGVSLAITRHYRIGELAPIPGNSDRASGGSTDFHEYTFRCTVGRVQTLTHTDALARFGHALSDVTRTRILLNLNASPSYPADLADQIGVSRQTLSNHLACLRGCGLVVAVPQGRRTRYELADARIGHALDDLLGLVLAVDPECRCVGPDGSVCGCA